ncbi:FtsX-like permease family protein [Lederbergia wuyishanensis]|uniref:ABC transport system permease protein n=1 Tax=Lederbergia wuyishanensis TaxID=1347903 RepID=A0ABU0D806_9BACI|nr:FtsX-like permease family protein [Lederbergia wuyishanensis]MCJ8009338.1 ABC transporter permease [Lederbergia wuyishanensis]MDQ0344527.1 putative ABC transport system permease protein [Lederbergia wuyishanensis]
MNHWQVAWRNLMRRKLRSFLMILSIVIGVASTFAVVAAVDSAEKAFPIYLKNAFGKADFNINGTEAYFSEKVYQDVKKIKNMTSIAVLKENTKIEIEAGNLSPIQKRVVLTGYSDLDTPVTGFHVVKGSLDSGGAVITDRTAKVWKVDVGDSISFKTDHGVQSIKVSAIVKYTVELMGPSSWSMANYHPWSVAVPLSIVQDWYRLSGKIDNIQVKINDASKLERMESQLDQFVKNYDAIYMQPVVIDFESTFKTLDSFFLALYIAGCLGIALSAFIIFNSFYVNMKERRNEFAVLKTVGYTPTDIQSMVFTEVILISVIGTTCGLLLGYAFGLGLKSLIFLIYSVYEGSMVMMKGMILSVLAGMIVPVLAAWYPIRQEGNVSVIEVLKENQATSFRPNNWLAIIGILLIISGFFIKHLLLIIPLMIGIILVYPYLFKLFDFLLKSVYRLVFQFSGEMATRNIYRNLGRTSMTSAILCLGITMIVLMSSLNSALLQTYERVIYSSYGGNLDIMFHHVEKEDLEALKNIEGVDEAVTYSLQSVVWNLHDQQRKLPVYGVGEEWIDRFSLFTIPDMRNSDRIKQLNSDEILLDKIAYDVWGGKVGESIWLDTLKGLKAYKVAGIVDSMKNSGYGAFMKEETFKESFGLKFERNALVIKNENTSPLQLRERIFDQFGERIEEMFGPEDWVSVISATFTGSFTIINGLVVLAIIVSGIGITNTLVISVMERIREIGVMRAVGITRRQIIGMILLEGFGIGLAATIIGSLFGILLIYITSTFMEVSSLTFDFGISWIIIVTTTLFGLSVSLISSLAPASSAAKTKLSEALRYE